MHLKHRCSFAIDSFENMVSYYVYFHLIHKEGSSSCIETEEPNNRFNNEFSLCLNIKISGSEAFHFSGSYVHVFLLFSPIRVN